MASLSKPKTLLDLFPVPEFLLLSTAGIAISDYDIKFVEFHRGILGDGFNLTHSSQTINPKGAILAGIINNSDEIVSVLKTLASKYRLRYVNATLPEEKAYLFTATIDWVPSEDMHDAVAFIVEENVPLALTDAVFSYEIIREDKETNKTKVAVSVLPKDVVETYTTLFESAGITPISFDLESQAIARAIIHSTDKGSYLIISIAPKKTGLYVVESGIVVFSTSLSYGIGTGSTPENMEDLKGEVRKVLVYWEAQNNKSNQPAPKVEKIILSGYKASDKDLAGKLLEGVDIPHEVGDVWVNLSKSSRKNVSQEVFEKSLEYASAIGLALTCDR